MRIGVILEPRDDRSFESLRDLVVQAESIGLDLCWIRAPSSDGSWSMTALGAALGAVTEQVRLAVQLPLGDHPVELAEELIVADLAVGGRILGILDPEGLASAVVDESLEVLLASLAPRSFTHRGARWSVPRSEDGSVRVTPGPAQFELPIHLLGCGWADVAGRFGVAPVMGSDDAPPAAVHAWSTLAKMDGGAKHRWRRMAVRDWADSMDTHDLIGHLRLEQAAWGMDTAVIDLSDRSPEAQSAAIEEIGRSVRPSLQLDTIPVALAQLWDRARHPV